MSGNLAFIKELEIGEPSVENTDSQEQEVNQEEQSDNTDFVQEQETSATETDKNDAQEGTEPNELAELKKMVEGMEKRIADKDKYIEELREQSKSQTKTETQEQEVVETDDEFWDDPVGKFKELQRTIQIQQMQIQETIYANTVEGYWDTVNQKDLKLAAETDPEFAKQFNSSAEPYKTAYEYLSAKKQSKIKDETSLREKLREEERQKILEEMKKGSNRETVPSLNNMGSSSSKSSKASEDGFASYFGSEY